MLTRDGDRFVGLEERTAIANDARADLFVSIHANGAEARAARGIETYFVSLEATTSGPKRLAIEENEAFGAAATPRRPAAIRSLAILGDMIATEHLVESQEFARLALGAAAPRATPHSRGVKQAPFVVLMGVQMPAALVEIGFITNAARGGGAGGAPPSASASSRGSPRRWTSSAAASTRGAAARAAGGARRAEPGASR